MAANQIDAAGDVYEVDCTVSQLRVAAIRQTLTVPINPSDCEDSQCRKPQRVLKKSRKVSKIEQTASVLWLQACASIPQGLCSQGNGMDAQLNEHFADWEFLILVASAGVAAALGYGLKRDGSKVLSARSRAIAAF